MRAPVTRISADFEALLADSGTTIVKCFLHISKDEQKERLQARIDNPEKHWKFDPSDLEARKQWDDYQQGLCGRAWARHRPKVCAVVCHSR